MTGKKNLDGNETLTLGRSQVLTLLGMLPKCPRAYGFGGSKAKVMIPAKVLADYVATIYQQYAYQCGPHWHLTSTEPVGQPFKPAKLPALYALAHTEADTSRQRMFIYGTRDQRGRWYYRYRPAVYRDHARREGEL